MSKGRPKLWCFTPVYSADSLRISSAIFEHDADQVWWRHRTRLLASAVLKPGDAARTRQRLHSVLPVLRW